MPLYINQAPLKRWFRFAIAVFWAASVLSAQADPSVPWTPSPAARHALELLADEASLDLPVTQWPLPRGAVARAIDALPQALPPSLESARARVQAELKSADGAELSASLRSRDEALTGFGDEGTPGSWLGVRTAAVNTSAVSAQFGLRLDQGTTPGKIDTKLRLDDSAFATEFFGQQLQAFAHRSWWGPGWQSSILLGNNAPPVYGLGLQRASAGRSESPWLSWLGPWTYDFFVAGNDDPMNSYLVGTRITFRPWSNLEIALSRTAQWGGRGRPQSFDSFVRMLIGVGVNGNNASESANDPANELSGFDLRWRCSGGLRCAAYTQLIGEDTTHHVPARYLGLYGLETWSADGTQRWFGEYAETICGVVFSYNPVRPCAYRNHAYPQGYTTAGRWIGASFGADSRVLTLGWMNVESGTSLRVHGGRVGSRVGVFDEPLDPQHSGRLVGLNARQSWTVGRATVGAELDWLQVDAQLGRQREARAGMNVRLPF